VKFGRYHPPQIFVLISGQRQPPVYGTFGPFWNVIPSGVDCSFFPVLARLFPGKSAQIRPSRPQLLFAFQQLRIHPSACFGQTVLPFLLSRFTSCTTKILVCSPMRIAFLACLAVSFQPRAFVLPTSAPLSCGVAATFFCESSQFILARLSFLMHSFWLLRCLVRVLASLNRCLVFVLFLKDTSWALRIFPSHLAAPSSPQVRRGFYSDPPEYPRRLGLLFSLFFFLAELRMSFLDLIPQSLSFQNFSPQIFPPVHFFFRISSSESRPFFDFSFQMSLPPRLCMTESGAYPLWGLILPPWPPLRPSPEIGLK